MKVGCCLTVDDGGGGGGVGEGEAGTGGVLETAW